MADQILFSICIPAYKRTDYLRRLLDSIVIQTMHDFEVIITDDSNDSSVEELSALYQDRFPLTYHKNPRPLGSPENWNEAIRRANGKWIKLMHDDDWFSEADSLQVFADKVAERNHASFLFCSFRNVFLDSGNQQEVHAAESAVKALRKDPTVLFAGNIIGPPSVVLHKNDKRALYDNRLKWLVDIDFYMRCLAGHQALYIDRVLVNVGIGTEQLTADFFRQRPVEIPENFYLLNKVGAFHLRNWRVYDAWWRLMRNLQIKSQAEIQNSGYAGRIPVPVQSMIRWQTKIPEPLLHSGAISKMCMSLHYLLHYRYIDRR